MIVRIQDTSTYVPAYVVEVIILKKYAQSFSLRGRHVDETIFDALPVDLLNFLWLVVWEHQYWYSSQDRHGIAHVPVYPWVSFAHDFGKVHVAICLVQLGVLSQLINLHIVVKRKECASDSVPREDQAGDEAFSASEVAPPSDEGALLVEAFDYPGTWRVHEDENVGIHVQGDTKVEQRKAENGAYEDHGARVPIEQVVDQIISYWVGRGRNQLSQGLQRLERIVVHIIPQVHAVEADDVRAHGAHAQCQARER